MDFHQSFFKIKAVKPPVELAPTAVNNAVVIQAGHIVGFIALHLLRRLKNRVLDSSRRWIVRLAFKIKQ